MGNNCNRSDVAHSMLIVGSGRERGVEYWLVRNSHGTDWGEEGYYKMRKTAECYDNAGFGQTMEVFMPKEGGNELEGKQASYKFSENLNYDWESVAKALKTTKPKPRMPVMKL